jgi:hypothetical protein
VVTDRVSGSIAAAGVWRTSRVVAKDPLQRPGDVVRSELRRGDLIQQRLELVIVVAVKQDHVDVVLGKLLGAGDASEPPPTMSTVSSLMPHRLFSGTLVTHRGPQQ